ncbi:MAG: MarR family winged helix-turn-helix transcriptional regulator [Sneathiellales bacterium]|nr:MarR family winged helix-turn-helix transcriptional regulator [Sneathiellales bacterium]
MTDLILDLFKLNSQLLTAGDRLVADLGLTSARWQVLGSIVAAEQPQPVAWLARDMEAHRQNVQRIVNDLEKNGFVRFEPNPHHKRAHLVVLTEKGRDVFDAAMRLQSPWAKGLADGLSLEELRAGGEVLKQLRQKLQNDED